MFSKLFASFFVPTPLRSRHGTRLSFTCCSWSWPKDGEIVSAKTDGWRILQNADEILPLGILDLGTRQMVGQTCGIALHEGRLAPGKKSVLYKCLSGILYTGWARLQAVFMALVETVGSSASVLLSTTLVGFVQVLLYQGHFRDVTRNGQWSLSAERESTPRGLQPRQVPLSFFHLPSLHSTSAAPSFNALHSGCWGYRAGKEIPAGVPRGWALVAPHCKAERSGRKMKSLRIASVARQKLCKACLLPMKNYPERRFLSCERHLLIIPQEQPSPSQCCHCTDSHFCLWYA